MAGVACAVHSASGPFRPHPPPASCLLSPEFCLLSPALHSASFCLRLCVKPPLLRVVFGAPGAVFWYFSPHFFLFFAKRTQLCFFHNCFMSKHMCIFQLGSFGKKHLFWKELCQPRFPRPPRACLYDPCSHPDSLTIPEIPYAYFGRFGRFGSFFYCRTLGADSDNSANCRRRRAECLPSAQRLEGLEAFLFASLCSSGCSTRSCRAGCPSPTRRIQPKSAATLPAPLRRGAPSRPSYPTPTQPSGNERAQRLEAFLFATPLGWMPAVQVSSHPRPGVAAAARPRSCR